MRRLFNIRFKLLGVIAVLVVSLAGLVALYVPKQVAESARRALQDRAMAEAKLLAEAAGASVDFGMMEQAQEQLRQAQADPLVAWAAIYGPDGKRIGRGFNDAHQPAARVPKGWRVDDKARDRATSEGGDAERRRRGDETGGWIELAYAPMYPTSTADEKGEEKKLLGYLGLALKTEDIRQRIDETQRNIVLAAFVVLGFGLVFAYFVAQQISRPLEQVTAAAARIAEGDVSQDLRIKATRDEVGDLADAFATMQARLRDLAGRIGDGAEALASAAAGMFSEVREQEALATQQTASLEEIRRTLETLTQAADQVTVDAETVRDIATQSLGSSQQIAERTRLVSEHSDRIGEILSLIQNIADKSDLLALNASLEGTKAGEVGRGFSLVAAEMRRLSEHVMDSVRDIRKLIADTREASHASVMATEEGIKLSQQTANAANKISEAVARQREGTGQVKASADEIVRVVNESLKGRAEATRSAEGLLQLSQDLKDAASTFRLSPDAGEHERSA